MNPLVWFSAFVIATGVRSYLYGPGASSDSGQKAISESRSDDGYESDHQYTVSSYSPSAERAASILSYSRNIKGNGEDATSFSTSNGISSSHNVYLVPGHPSTLKEDSAKSNVAMNGHSYHTSPEGMQVSLTWSADESGGVPAAPDHRLPKAVHFPGEHAEVHRQAHLASSSLYGGNGNGNGYQHQHHVHSQPDIFATGNTHQKMRDGYAYSYASRSNINHGQSSEGGYRPGAPEIPHLIQRTAVHSHPTHEAAAPVSYESQFMSDFPQSSRNERYL